MRKKIGGGQPGGADPRDPGHHPGWPSRRRYQSVPFYQPYILQAKPLIYLIQYVQYSSPFVKNLSRQGFADGLFDALTRCPGKALWLAAGVFRNFFKTHGFSQYQQLFSDSIAIFAHQQMHPNHQPVMPRKGCVQGLGYFSGNFFAIEHPVCHR